MTALNMITVYGAVKLGEILHQTAYLPQSLMPWHTSKYIQNFSNRWYFIVFRIRFSAHINFIYLHNVLICIEFSGHGVINFGYYTFFFFFFFFLNKLFLKVK